MNNFSLTSFAADYGQITSLVKEDGSIWFHAAQLLANTGTKTTTAQAKAAIEERLGKGYNILIPLQTAGGTQETLFFAEAAATWYLSRSRTEAGKALDRKIHTEILPQIRRTGAYQPSAPAPELPSAPAPALALVPTEQVTQTGLMLMMAQHLHGQQQQLDNIQTQVDRQDRIQQEAAAAMAELPPANVPTPVLVTRRAILKAVSNYCTAKGIEQRTVWNLLYEELRLRCGVAVKLRAKISPQESYLDVVVRIGYGEQLYAIALDLLGINPEANHA